jgi:hypothetical protein
VPDADDWKVDHPAIWLERYRPDRRDKESHTITVRHPTYPYTARVTEPTSERLTAIAADYLYKVARPLFGFRDELLRDRRSFVDTKALIPLAWLPLVDDVEHPDASSFWINHYDHIPGRNAELPQPVDRTAILLAVPSIEQNDERHALGSRMAIRIVVHVAPGAGGQPTTVRITGATCSSELLRIAKLDSPDLRNRFKDFAKKYLAAPDELRDKVAELTGFNSKDLWVDGISVRARPQREAVFEIYLTYQRQTNPPRPAHMVIARVPLGGELERMTVRKRPLVAHCAAVTESLFHTNPPSRERPNRRGSAFATDLKNIDVPGLSAELPKGGGQARIQLRDDSKSPEIQVMKSRLVRPKDNETEVETITSPIRNARTNEFAALSAYQHARELFDTMRSYGLVPKSYFKQATLPLLVRYRAGIYPGPGKDGKTVNAMVDYESPRRSDRSSDQSRTTKLEELLQAPPPLQIRFALADVKRSGSRREPLGIACDPRWSWHEYAHVLIAASTGALELTFAHSTGDALAAILGDPSLEVDHPLRMATFPWVFLNRWHDRSVHSGWSWCGSYHRQSEFPPDSAFRRKGYRSEQILSTSLFRLYRALGGDTNQNGGKRANSGKSGTAAGRMVRQRAADYTAYLIMRAIAWLGPIIHVTAETPDQFVSALIDADVATLLGPATPPHRPPLPRRVGGCAHKVVRWAFEAQGLYATDDPDPDAIINAPGLPPKVDVFIDDRRKEHDPAHEPGAYTPVPLGEPFWYATDAAIHIDRKGNVTVSVGNRGREPASKVVVEIWYARRPQAPAPPPNWDGHAKSGKRAWTCLGATEPKPVAPGATVKFMIERLPTRGELLVLAVARCEEDPANTEADTGLPCAAGAPLVDLVAGDNNLGLRAQG